MSGAMSTHKVFSDDCTCMEPNRLAFKGFASCPKNGGIDCLQYYWSRLVCKALITTTL